MRLEAHLLTGDTAETERLRVEGVALVVAQWLGRGPRQAVRTELAGDRGSLVVDHRHGSEYAVLGADHYGRLDAHADSTVLDRRGQLGHQQVPVGRALIRD